ncbi:MAG: UDP-N-acetylmuramate dehydrogenase [Deltaproteobacteria bacterium]|nr:UDP-N-acetylmuramate dehydrogenase [Deltaproteobacteria bacterium]
MSGQTGGASSATSNTARAEILAELALVPELSIKTAVPGAQCTTFAIGGPLEVLLEPNSEAALSATLRALFRHREQFQVLGAGSNLLISDQGVAGFTLRLGRYFRYRTATQDSRFEVGAAMSLMSLSREISEAGFSGLEFAGGIPASFGGAVRMNAGAHGGEIGSVIQSVRVAHPDGALEVIPARELEFSYRHSRLPSGSLVVSAEIKVAPGDRAAIVRLRQEHLAERKRRQPLSAPSAGSVFRNPSSEISAGAVLERAGMKGVAVGGARVSLLHANWIINDKRQASAADVRELIRQCQRKALEVCATELIPEVVQWESEAERAGS